MDTLIKKKYPSLYSLLLDMSNIHSKGPTRMDCRHGIGIDVAVVSQDISDMFLWMERDLGSLIAAPDETKILDMMEDFFSENENQRYFFIDRKNLWIEQLTPKDFLANIKMFRESVQG